jgi:hypothetical protein
MKDDFAVRVRSVGLAPIRVPFPRPEPRVAVAAVVRLFFGLDNDEHGKRCNMFDGPAGRWSAVRPSLVHYD